MKNCSMSRELPMIEMDTLFGSDSKIFKFGSVIQSSDVFIPSIEIYQCEEKCSEGKKNDE